MNENGRGVAVIGCGDMGSKHARAWSARPDARVVAVYDPLAERAERVAAEVGAAVCPSFEAAILSDGVSCVSVATPAAFHAPVACFAAANGRHVLSEKPLALTLEQAEAMRAAARENSVLLGVSFQYRAFARNRRLRELFQSGAFGGPIFARFTDVREVRPKIAMHRQSLNGGPVIDMVGHYIDLMRFITGAEPVSVSATGQVYGRGKARLAEVDDFAIDAASIEVRYQDGHSLSVFANWGMPEGFPGFGEEYLIGPEISARATPGDSLAIQYADRLESWQPETPGDSGPAARIADLVHALDTGASLEVSGDDGVIALRTCLAALESIATGRTVTL
jgi:predicted dehydrogenase